MAGLVALAVVFTVVSALRSSLVAFLALCWVPLAALVLAMVAQQSLGYGALGVVFATIVASIGLVGLGVGLCVKAGRKRTTAVAPLVWGTVVAGGPVLVLLLLWLVQVSKVN